MDRSSWRFVRPSAICKGRPLQDQAHELKGNTVGHVFHFQNGKVARFDIREHD